MGFLSKHISFRRGKQNNACLPAAELDSHRPDSFPSFPGSSLGHGTSHVPSAYGIVADHTYTNDKEKVAFDSDNTGSYQVAPPTYSWVQSNHAAPLNIASTTVLSTRSATSEDPLSELKKFDTWFLVDNSGSMTYQGRWKQTAAQYDEDGIDIHFLNSDKKGAGIRDKIQVMRLFDGIRVMPEWATPTGASIGAILGPYIRQIRRNIQLNVDLPKPLNLVIITDGVATDNVSSVVEFYAKQLDNMGVELHQVGLQFVQVGNDKGAADGLRRLDDELVGIRDMVDTTPFTQLDNGQLTTHGLIKMLVGGINRKIDGEKSR